MAQQNGMTPQDMPVFMEGPPKLSDLRDILIRLEETIIFALIERAQFKRNETIYKRGKDGVFGSEEYLRRRSGFSYSGSYLDFMVERTEQVHALVNRYTSPDEEAFFPNRISNAALLRPQNYPPVLHPNNININEKLMSIYTERIVPGLCEDGDDKQYGSSAVCDTVVLQALSRRIHYGKFVAEAKFAADRKSYSERIRKQDAEWLMNALTVKAIEEKVLSRVELKASTYGRDPRDASATTSPPSTKRAKTRRCKIDPTRIRALYADWVMPLTKEVELLYLMHRLTGPSVSYCGHLSPSHEVAMSIVGGNATSDDNRQQLLACSDDKAVVQAVLSNHTKYGVVPLMDAFGVIRQTRTLLCCASDDLVVSGVRVRRHRFELMTIAESTEHSEGEMLSTNGNVYDDVDTKALCTGVQTIYADKFAVQCCASWLEINASHAKIVCVDDRETVLRRVQSESNARSAALLLQSRYMDKPPSMRTIARISGPSTVVRHAIVTKSYCGMPSGQDRTMFQVAVLDKPGMLNHVLHIFSGHGVNLTVLESYPLINSTSPHAHSTRKSMFFVECEGHQQDRHVADALCDLRKSAMSLRVIGSYQFENEQGV